MHEVVISLCLNVHRDWSLHIPTPSPRQTFCNMTVKGFVTKTLIKKFCNKNSNTTAYNSLTFKSAMLGFSFCASGFELTLPTMKVSARAMLLENSCQYPVSRRSSCKLGNPIFTFQFIPSTSPLLVVAMLCTKKYFEIKENQRIFPVQTWVTNLIYIANCLRKYLNLNTQLINSFILIYYAGLWSQIFIDFPSLHT